MSNDAITRLQAIVGGEHVLDTLSDMAVYLKGPGRPLAVVLPAQTAEVSEIVKLANQLNLKVSVGGAVADSRNLDGGIALVMSRMNRLLEIDRENLVAQVEPGLSHLEFIRKTAEENLYFPVDPYRFGTSSIGGCFAVGDADAKSFQYGPTRTYLLGFEMVLPTGEILDIGNKCIKNVAGYDYIHFAVGAQGSLGIFTKLLVKLLPTPQARASVLAVFPSLQRTAESVQTLIKRNIHPTRVSLFSRPLAAEVLPGIDGQLVMVDFEGFRESTKALTREIAAVFSLAGASEVNLIEDPGEHGDLWLKWLAVKGRLNCPYQTQTIEYSVGPLQLAKSLGALAGIVGDLGEWPGINVEALLGNIRLVLPEAMALEDRAALTAKINALAMAHGGNVADCLGTKLVCESYRDPAMWETVTGLLATIRRQFDPLGVMAPGVTFS
ncbi:MAG: FAD-binding oxidoreductase [Negativicutes bacterium]|nr:FAD-binding oxidoreductase [Negativicutes bacterium]